MTKISQFIDELSEEDLELLEREIKEGHIHKYIDRKKEFFKVKDKICPVCGNMVQADCHVLIWGEPSVRKKAHFCGGDCLQYFLNKDNLQKKKYHRTDKNATSKTKTII
jgi:hypothetical protein